MTTRFSGFQVTLKADVREDDAEAIINAIRMIKGVADVRPIETTYGPEILRQRLEIVEKLEQFTQDLLK